MLYIFFYQIVRIGELECSIENVYVYWTRQFRKYIFVNCTRTDNIIHFWRLFQLNSFMQMFEFHIHMFIGLFNII